MTKKTISRELRKYLYGLAIALVPIAVHYGWIDVEASVIIIPLIVAIFNLTPKEVEEVNGNLSILGGQVAPTAGSESIPVTDTDLDLDEGEDVLNEISAPILDGDDVEVLEAEVAVASDSPRHAA